MTQQTVVYPTTARAGRTTRPGTSVLRTLLGWRPSRTTGAGVSRRPQPAYGDQRHQVTGDNPTVTGHEWAILLTMQRH